MSELRGALIGCGFFAVNQMHGWRDVEGAVRNVCYDGVEVLRAISYLARDKDWGAYETAISNLEISERSGNIDIRYDGQCQGPDGSAGMAGGSQ